jgi:hypothetical protein
MINSTNDFGPLYNKRETLSGFLVPGTRLPPTHPPGADDHMPSEGYGKFRGFSATTNGNLHFAFDDPADVVYVTRDDIDVALVLAFSEEKPGFPSLSLESADPSGLLVLEKVWEPKWIGHTKVGKTLYATDYNIGAICGYHGSAALREASEADRGKAMDLFDRFSRVKSENCTLRICPGPIEIAWTKTADELTQCRIIKSDYHIISEESGYDGDGNYQKWHGNHTKHAQIFNAKADEIAEIWPVFERYRQLGALLYSFTELRARGFQPSPELNYHIQAVANQYKSRPPVPKSQRLIMWHYD